LIGEATDRDRSERGGRYLPRRAMKSGPARNHLPGINRLVTMGWEISA
jgi:hypothetical protein